MSRPSDVALRAMRIGQVKQEAARRILDLAPQWRQRTAIARGLWLERKARLEGLTENERAEEAALLALWDAVGAVRAASDQLEARIEGMTRAELETFRTDLAEHWP